MKLRQDPALANDSSEAVNPNAFVVLMDSSAPILISSSFSKDWISECSHNLNSLLFLQQKTPLGKKSKAKLLETAKSIAGNKLGMKPQSLPAAGLLAQSVVGKLGSGGWPFLLPMAMKENKT